MSHFSQIKTQIRNLASLQAALTDLAVDWKSGSKTIRGYRGQTRNAEIIIEQANGYDIGFSWNGNEYELVADLQYWQQDLTVNGFLRQVTQRYAYHTVVQETARQGFQIAEQEKNEDGSIRLFSATLECLMSDFVTPLEQTTQRSNLEPELGGLLREDPDRSGMEPELGGFLRQKGVYVDEVTCIGCKHCAHVARNTFYIEPEYGRSRVVRQDGDSEELIQEAIDTCPVDCIHWLDYTEVKKREEERQYQVIPLIGYPVDEAVVAAHRRRKKKQLSRRQKSQY